MQDKILFTTCTLEMLFLKNDYGLGAHPKVMQALNKTNMDYADGYGIDDFCEQAICSIKNLIGTQDVDVHFLPGGTLTNLTAIGSFLRPHEAVISPMTGHICVHETGAIEATGHKVIHVQSNDGKISPEQIDQVMLHHEDEHFVLPKLVYISNSTEMGGIYSKSELEALRRTCKEHDLLLYMDGARLAMAVSSAANDLTVDEIPSLVDVFYLGGTKNGLLFGEALVIVNDQLKKDFRFLLKQRGGLMAKSRLMGIQFKTILEDSLYFQLGAHANSMAQLLAGGISKKGYDFACTSQTNLIFPVFKKQLAEQLSRDVMFETWSSNGEDIAIRLVTSWGTTEDEVNRFLSMI